MKELLINATNKTNTNNGAGAFNSTLNCVLDFFSRAAAARKQNRRYSFYGNPYNPVEGFKKAYAEDPDLAMKCLFFVRDIRQGLGERDTFRDCLTWLAQTHPISLRKNLQYVAEFGRWDDLICLLDTQCQKQAITIISKQLNEDIKAMKANQPVSLLGKWLPSENTSCAATRESAKKLRTAFNFSSKGYRKLLSALRKHIAIIENNLREKDYTFDYSKQPSKAMFKYRRAFNLNDRERYCQYLQDVADGKAKINTSALTPYDVLLPAVKNYLQYIWVKPETQLSEAERQSIVTTWNKLPDYTNGENALVVVDGSGSMEEPGFQPVTVAQSLALYYAERNTGAFHNCFMTFSRRPQMVELKGQDILDKLEYSLSYNECSNTNIKAVFDLLLKTAVENNVPQSELPSRIYIVSDMEFDQCAENADVTAFEYAKDEFENHGYKLPQIVFWNVNAYSSVPVTQNEQGVALVSGYSPKLFNMLNTKDFTPLNVMLDILKSERYNCIKA